MVLLSDLLCSAGVFSSSSRSVFFVTYQMFLVDYDRETSNVFFLRLPVPALISGGLWVVAVFTTLFQKLCTPLFQAVARDPCRTDVAVLEKHV